MARLEKRQHEPHFADGAVEAQRVEVTAQCHPHRSSTRIQDSPMPESILMNSMVQIIARLLCLHLKLQIEANFLIFRAGLGRAKKQI